MKHWIVFAITLSILAFGVLSQPFFYHGKDPASYTSSIIKAADTLQKPNDTNKGQVASSTNIDMVSITSSTTVATTTDHTNQTKKKP